MYTWEGPRKVVSLAAMAEALSLMRLLPKTERDAGWWFRTSKGRKACRWKSQCLESKCVLALQGQWDPCQL